MGRRIERVNEMLRRELAELIAQTATGELPMIAIDYVETAPDLKTAKVYVSLIGNQDRSDQMVEFLESKRQEFQKAIGRNGNLKFTPVLDFRISQFDDNLEKIDRLIEKVHES